MSLSDEGRTLRARLGIQTRLATEDPVAMTAKARGAFQQSFIDAAWASIGPFTEALIAEHPELPEEALFPEVEAEVLRRAEVLRKLHMTRLSFAAAKARGKKKGRAVPLRTPVPSPPEGVTSAGEAAFPEVESTSTPEGGR